MMEKPVLYTLCADFRAKQERKKETLDVVIHAIQFRERNKD